MKKITVEKDLGQKETYEKWNGKFLNESAYDKVIKVTDEDMGVMKPIHSLDGSDVPLAYVVTNVFPKQSKIRDILTTIEDTSTMRANCSGPIDKEEMLAKGLVEGVDYKLRTPNSYHTRTKSGGWGMIAYSNEIHSVMIGHKRGRFTGGIDVSGWCKDNKEKWEALQEISEHNETAFAKANDDIYRSQKSFAENNIRPEHRIGEGIFTTLSANRYSAYQSAKMAAHVDSGDTDAGMTSMCVFREGDYDGAYLCFPRYGIAIDAPDNSVVIADSQEVHGVTPISGKGQRFSCVAYCDRRLATIGVYGKQEKLIGKYAAKTSGNLNDFLGD